MLKSPKEAGRLHGWWGRFWHGRYECSPITNEEEIQVARLKYLLSQGCKEGLVASPWQWPGVHCAKALMNGTRIRGIWVDRTALYHAKRKKGGEKVRPIDFEEETFLEFAPLPCWSHLPPEQYQQRIRDLVREIEEETARLHRTKKTQPLGRQKVLRMNPLHRPKSFKWSPNPRAHTATRAARKLFIDAYRIFIEAYKAASAKLRNGDLTVGFP